MESERIEPAVLHASTLSPNEKAKVRRIVTPKPASGNLDVPKDIFQLWNTKDGKEKLFAMWAKSGGIKAGSVHQR